MKVQGIIFSRNIYEEEVVKWRKSAARLARMRVVSYLELSSNEVGDKIVIVDARQLQNGKCTTQLSEKTIIYLAALSPDFKLTLNRFIVKLWR